MITGVLMIKLPKNNFYWNLSGKFTIDFLSEAKNCIFMQLAEVWILTENQYIYLYKNTSL